MGIEASIIPFPQVLPLISGSKHSLLFASIFLKQEFIRELLCSQLGFSKHTFLPLIGCLHLCRESTMVLRAPHPSKYLLFSEFQDPRSWPHQAQLSSLALTASVILTRFFSLSITFSWLKLELKQQFCHLLST